MDAVLAPPARVLVADGDPVVAVSLSQLLQFAGFEVATATRADEAMARAEQFRPDAVVLELDVLTVCGMRLCRHLRLQPWGQGILLVALTGLPDDQFRRAALAGGIDRYLLKPVFSDELIRTLKGAPGVQGQSAPCCATSPAPSPPSSRTVPSSMTTPRAAPP